MRAYSVEILNANAMNGCSMAKAGVGKLQPMGQIQPTVCFL